MNPNVCKLYLVSHSDGMEENLFLQKLDSALQSGVTLLQLREKEKSGREFYQLAHRVHALAQAHGVPLIINDRIDIALAVDAEGVHIGQSDLPVREGRRLLGPDKIVGATAKTLTQALAAQQEGADYLGVGAIYPTTTKVQTTLTSVDTLREICQHVRIPVNAIGGLQATNLSVLQGSGIAGVCVVSYIMQAVDPAAAVQRMCAAIQPILV